MFWSISRNKKVGANTSGGFLTFVVQLRFKLKKRKKSGWHESTKDEERKPLVQPLTT